MFRRIIFLIPLLLVMMSGITYAAPGDLDTTFNPPNGAAPYDSGGDDAGSAVAIQSDGKIVVVGISDNGTDFDVLVLRYNSDGSLDTSFGTNGVVTYDSGNGDYVSAVAIQSDGKIVVVGRKITTTTSDDVLILRYNTDGSADASFGTNGIVTYDTGNSDIGYAVAIQQDGRIVVAASSLDGPDRDVVVLRYNTSGQLDTSFGTNGVVTYDSGEWDNGWALAIQSDGKIVLAGRTKVAPVDYDFLILRYNTDGTLDNTFGTNGIVTYDTGSIDEAYAVAIDSDGKIVVAGESHIMGPQEEVLVLRYNTDGSLDTYFGTNGVVTYGYGQGTSDYCNAVAVQSDGKIVVVGETDPGADGLFDLYVLRYKTNGQLDNSFGTNGVVTYDHDQGSDDYGNALALQSDGKIVVVGETDISGSWVFDVLVARFIDDPPAPCCPQYSEDGGSCFIASAAYGFHR